jgi:cellulose synthase/poly-beta-1,6-N-acetylglucosamine synthase-like glycosyltransferase
LKDKKVIFYIPTLNSEKNIETCLTSIINQKQSVKDIIVIDAKSTDKTTSICKKYHIQVIKQRYRGLANARNLALKNSKTEFTASIDADCFLDTNWLEKILGHFKDPNVAGVCGKLIEKNNRTLADKWREFHLKQHWGNNSLINPPFIFGSNSIFRTSALKKIKGYNEKYKTNYEDVDISERLKANGFKIIYEPAALCYHMREDTFLSIIKTARNWSFHSYQLPNNLLNLSRRVLIYNPYVFLNLLFRDLINLKFYFIPITLLAFVYNQYYDLRCFAEKKQ